MIIELTFFETYLSAAVMLLSIKSQILKSDSFHIYLCKFFLILSKTTVKRCRNIWKEQGTFYSVYDFILYDICTYTNSSGAYKILPHTIESRKTDAV